MKNKQLILVAILFLYWGMDGIKESLAEGDYIWAAGYFIGLSVILFSLYRKQFEVEREIEAGRM